MDVVYRWIDGPALNDIEWAEEMQRIDPILAERGWMSWNKNTTRVCIAEERETGTLVAFYTLQLIPHIEPMFIRPSARGTDVAEKLIDHMQAFVTEAQIRGFVVTAENPAIAKQCERHDMIRVQSPVYVKV